MPLYMVNGECHFMVPSYGYPDTESTEDLIEFMLWHCDKYANPDSPEDGKLIWTEGIVSKICEKLNVRLKHDFYNKFGYCNDFDMMGERDEVLEWWKYEAEVVLNAIDRDDVEDYIMEHQPYIEPIQYHVIAHVCDCFLRECELSPAHALIYLQSLKFA